MDGLERALSAQEGAREKEEILQGRRSEVQGDAAEGCPATVCERRASIAGADLAARSDAALQGISVAADRCSYDEAKHGIAASSPCYSSESSTCLETGRAEAKQAKAPDVHGPSKEAICSRATEEIPSLLYSSLLESTHQSKHDISAPHEGRRKQRMLSEGASSTGCMLARPVSDAGSAPHPDTARCGQIAQAEQPSESRAGFTPPAVAHQDSCAADCTLVQSGQSCSARGDATGHLLQDSPLHDAGVCFAAGSAEECPGSADGTRVKYTRALPREPERRPCTEPAGQNKGRAGSSAGQQQRQIDGTLDLAIAVSMAVGLAVVLMCGVMMLASTHMSNSM